MFKSIQKFTDSTFFTSALKVTSAAVIPVLILSYYGNFQMGFTIALGSIFAYLSDIPSSAQNKTKVILITAFLVSGLTISVNLLYPFPLIFYPFLAIVIFCISMLAVYGQRATMVSFSCLVAISLAFANISTGWTMLINCGLIFSGALFYLLVSLIFQYLKPHRYVELELANCIKLTAKYLKLRGNLWTVDANRKAIAEKQLHLQVALNTIHQNIREALIGGHSSAAPSTHNQKMLLIFIALVEILELALSTAFDHNTLHKKFDEHPKVLRSYQNLAYTLASSLKQLSKSVKKRTNYISRPTLLNDLNALQLAIADYKTDLGATAASEGVFMLTTMLQYAEKQVEKIKIVERAFSSKFNVADWKGIDKDLDKFLNPQYYHLSTLLQNLSFASTIFRHSLRLTITLMTGLLIGTFVSFQNEYWILLTIIVIMRPGYGLTKERSFHRMIGTVVGGLVAFGILYFIQDKSIIGAFSIVSMLLGFAFTQINYKISATFVTMYVVFIYGIITPNISDLVQYRIIDTLVGVILAFIANHFLWPSWEFLQVPIHLEKAIKSNLLYLNEIAIYYNKKGSISTSYRLARKNAFIEIGNLMASYLRMTQEPKSKQQQLPLVYKLAVLNHSLMSSLASLGTYIQSHKTTKASDAFNIVVQTAIKNLENAIVYLKKDHLENFEDNNTIELSSLFTELKNIRQQELKNGLSADNEAFQLKMQEAQLVIEQLIWLTTLSESILGNIKIIKTKV